MVVLNTEKSLYCFLQEHGDNRVKKELLLFWGMHPNARFDCRAICYALDCSRLEAERALRAMVEERLLENNTCNGVILYSLTEDEPLRSLVSDLAKLDWRQWQLVFQTNISKLRGIGQSSDSTSNAP